MNDIPAQPAPEEPKMSVEEVIERTELEILLKGAVNDHIVAVVTAPQQPNAESAAIHKLTFGGHLTLFNLTQEVANGIPVLAKHFKVTQKGHTRMQRLKAKYSN